MPLRFHHVIERDFQHDLRLNYQPQTVIFQRVLQKPFRHFRDFRIGQPRISLSNIDQLFFIPHRERVIAEHPDALAMAVFDGSHDDIERRQFPLHLQPRFPALAGAIVRNQILDHEAFIPSGLRRGEQLL